MSPLPRTRLRRRAAAITALCFGAALLTTPGTATAQDDTTPAVDCAALGDNPIAAGLEAALESAVACGVEVRIDSRSAPHATVYATPDKRLHYVGTAAPVQDHLDRGPADSSLVASGGTLVQANAAWPLSLSHSDTAAPLLATDGVEFDWNGTQPVPTHSGSTALYDDLAPGLDLSVETAVSWADLTFDIADQTAWDALGAGLTVTAGGAISVPADTLLVSKQVAGSGRFDVTSPFLVRDAAGASYRAELTRATDGKLTVAFPQDTEASYPLTLTTTWSEIGVASGWWGGATSARPDLSLYRGEAGLDQPYFEAAGASATAVVGPYCDALTDPDCSSPAQAAANWGFRSPELALLLPQDAARPGFTLIEGSFRVDAASGSDCTAPDLSRTGTYLPGHNWVYRPSVAGTPITGSCENGTAVYDLAPWLTVNVLPANLAMLASAETARFDGDSARIDAYYAINHFTAPTFSCHTDPDSRNLSDSADLHYGTMHAKIWRPDLFGTRMTWAVTVRNRDTGEVLVATEPVEVVSGWSTGSKLAVPDGRYETRYEFVADDPSLSFTRSCYVETDTSVPEIEFAVLPGPRNVGGEVELAITVSDNGFPNGIDYQEISYGIGDADHESDGHYFTQETTSTVTVPLWSYESKVSVRVMDRVGNYVDDGISVYAQESRNDFNGDGFQDLTAVGRSNGNLYFYPGKGDGTFGARASLGGGWAAMDVVMAGDLTGDGKADLLVRDPRAGTLYTYPGDGKGGVGSRITVGPGWNAIGLFTASGDFNTDGKLDLLAVGKSDGKLYLYPGKGNGTFGSRIVASSGTASTAGGWNGYDTLTTLGDLDHDGRTDLLTRNSGTNGYELWFGTGNGAFGRMVTVSPSLADANHTDPAYSQVVGGGDFDGDGNADVLAVDSRTGNLVRRALDPAGWETLSSETVGTGWNAVRLPSTTVDGTYDFDGDGASDLLAQRTSTGIVYLYPGTGNGGLEPRFVAGVDSAGMTLIQPAGDFDGDGFSDLFVRRSDGTLYYYPGNGEPFEYGERRTIGPGWNAMSTITGGRDYNSDGRPDALAVQSSNGTLYFYPGKGDGTFGSRVSLGTGWNAMREVTAVGDLNHDGHADALAIAASDGCLYFYGGTGTGTLKPRVKVGCGWNAMDAITAVGDFNGDGHVDWLARRRSDGVLFLYPGNGSGNHTAAKQVGTGWNVMTIA